MQSLGKTITCFFPSPCGGENMHVYSGPFICGASSYACMEEICIMYKSIQPVQDDITDLG